MAFVLCTNLERVFKIKQTFKNLLEPLLVYQCIVRSVLYFQWYCWPVTSSVERRVEKSTQHNLLCCHQPVTEPQTWADRVLPSDNTTWPRCTLWFYSDLLYQFKPAKERKFAVLGYFTSRNLVQYTVTLHNNHTKNWGLKQWIPTILCESLPDVTQSVRHT